uniref:uncharacterized protein LOC122611027 n=1 Tax=Erigeron canadensis TaxID=72917 RepID=UPI001CB9AFC4|nr:uncharacterized protein LOC122611027 [Erigeron canadensis]
MPKKTYMPNQDDHAFLDPDGVLAGSNDQSPPRVTVEKEMNQGSSVDIQAPPKVGQGEDAREHTANYYSCRQCDLLFPSAQALGGHQNGHRNVRDYAKRLKRNEGIALSYGDYPYSAIGYHPQLGNPFSKPAVPNIQNPRSTTEFTVRRQSSVMFNSTQFSVYGRPERNPHSGNYGNSIGSADNSTGIVGGRGSIGRTDDVGLLRSYENSCISAGAFEAAGTSAGTN